MCTKNFEECDDKKIRDGIKILSRSTRGLQGRTMEENAVPLEPLPLQHRRYWIRKSFCDATRWSVVAFCVIIYDCNSATSYIEDLHKMFRRSALKTTKRLLNHPTSLRTVEYQRSLRKKYGTNGDVGVKEVVTKNTRWWSWSNLIYPIPTGVGLTLLAVLQWRRLNKQQTENEQQPIYTRNLRLSFYKAIPLRAMSRLWGYISGCYIPRNFRYWLYTAYSKLFGVIIDEIELPMESYKSLGKFFARRLKDGARPICTDRPIVSPADGTIVSVGRVTSCQVEQVKGVTYTIKSFLGSPTWLEDFGSLNLDSSPVNNSISTKSNLMKQDSSSNYSGWSISSTFLFYHYGLLTMHMYCINFIFNFLSQGVSFFSLSFKKQDVTLSDDTQDKTVSVDRQNQNDDECQPFDPHWNEYKSKLLHNSDNELYQIVIYLAPGDYHRFHSPAQWTVKFRRHFQGELLSVNPKIARLLPDLFVLNERAVYVGEWKHGFFSMTAVGATNVGSIKVHSDKGLQTNMRCRRKDFNQHDRSLETQWSMGQEVGEFRMGSTVVLLFEAPKDFVFDVEAGQTIQMGQALGKIGVSQENSITSE